MKWVYVTTQESVTTGQTDRQTDRQTDAGQSDPYVPLCFAGNTISYDTKLCMPYFWIALGGHILEVNM